MDDEIAADLEQKWALKGGALLLLSFFFPLIAPRLVLFTDLLELPVPGLKIMVLLPAILGLIAIGLALMTSGLVRATLLLFTVGLSTVVWMAISEAWAQAAFTATQAEAVANDPSGSVFLGYGLLIAVAFVGLAFCRQRPHSRLGARVAGVAGVSLLALHFVPMFDTYSLADLVVGKQFWALHWGVPIWALGGLLFSVGCAAQLVGLWESDDLAAATRLLGLLVITVPALALILETGLLGLSLVVKAYGGWIAIHMLLAAGLLGLLGQGLAPEPASH